MKKITISSAVFVAAFALAASAHAQVISVQFDNTNLNGTVTAGEIPETIWNADTNSTAYVGSGTSFANDLTDSTDTVTGVSENTVNNGTYPQYHTLDFSNAGDEDLFDKGYLSGFDSPTTFTLNLTGLNASDSYNLLLYVVGTANIAEQLSASDGTTTYYFDTATDSTGAHPLSSYVAASSTVSTGTGIADYVEFDGLTGSTTLTATINPTGGQDFNVAGFQLDNTGAGAVPEPGTVWTVALGLLGLIGFQRKRFFARS